MQPLKVSSSSLVFRCVIPWMACWLSAIAQSSLITPDQALTDLKKAATPASLSSATSTQKVDLVQVNGYRVRQAQAFLAAAQQARDFQARFPADPHLAEVRTIEVTSMLRAVRAGDSASETAAVVLADAYVADGRNSRRDRYVISAMSRQWALEKANLSDRSAFFAEYEKNAAALYAQFADVPEVHYLFLGLARNAPTPSKMRSIVADLLLKPAPIEVKSEAQALLDRLAMPGKAFPLKLVVNNGTEFDLAKNRGTPVVLYFWGSWGNANSMAMPLIRRAAAGNTAVFVGVNLDLDPGVTRAGLDGEPVPGLQHWEPLGVSGPLARQLLVDQVPCAYVFDRQGVLVGLGHPRELAALLLTASK